MSKKFRLLFILTIIILSVASLSGVVLGEENESSFSKNVYTEHTGDVVNIKIEVSDFSSSELSIQIGEAKNLGYELQGVIKGVDSYSDIELSFDTSKAGRRGKTVKVESGADSINVKKETLLKNPPINSFSYIMSLSVDNSEIDIAKMNLRDAGEPKPIKVQRVHSSEEKREIIKGSDNSFESVAYRDYTVIEVNSQGTASYVFNTTNASLYSKNSKMHRKNGLYVNLVVSKDKGNEINLPLKHVSVFRNGSNDKMYFVIDNSKYNRILPGKNVKFEFIVTKENEYIESGNYNATYKVERAKGKFYTGKDDVVTIRNSSGGVVHGTTNLAGNSEITVILSNRNKPLFKREKVTVRENGRFTVEFYLWDVNKTKAKLKFDSIAGRAKAKIIGRLEEYPETATPRTRTINTTTKTPSNRTITTRQKTQPTPPTRNTVIETTTEQKTTTDINTTTEQNGGNLPQPTQPGFTGISLVIAIFIASLIGLIVSYSST